MDNRANALATWCQTQLGTSASALDMVSGDASFRRYFRCHHQGRAYIAMDAPPEKEDSSTFVAIAQQWHRRGIRVPELVAVDLSAGFLLLEDFGDTQLLTAVAQSPSTQRQQWYIQAIDTLVHLQTRTADLGPDLPPYDAALLDREMALFSDWLLDAKLGLQPSAAERGMLQTAFERLREAALAQPRVCVHRDYHSRNLMCLADASLGILDFQDAVWGPVSYDLVSLIRDCYVRWPEHEVEQWARYYHAQASAAKILSASWEAFYQDMEWMGMQRHLKASGIFARLALRDGKTAYLQDIPNTLQYLEAAARGYSEFNDLAEYLAHTVIPAYQRSMA